MTEQSPLVLRSAQASLAAQVLFTGVTCGALIIPSGRYGILTAIAILETAAQAIEFAWYALAVFRYREIRTWTRYIDWYLSTPTMLVSTIAFLIFLRRRRQDDQMEIPMGAVFDIFDASNRAPVIAILILNALMLSFGLAVERGAMSQGRGLILGTLSFIGSFYFLFGYFAIYSPTGVALFAFMFTVWSLYGLCATLPEDSKNISYNLLDIVSKNFYGVFIFGYALSVA